MKNGKTIVLDSKEKYSIWSLKCKYSSNDKY